MTREVKDAVNPRWQVTLLIAGLLTLGLGWSTAFSVTDGVNATRAAAHGDIDVSKPVAEPAEPAASGEPAEPAAAAALKPNPTPTATTPPAMTGPPVYLTFDDGPDPTITPQILDLLKGYGAKATFFAQGSQVQAYPEVARRIVAEGHSLQNHAWNHPRLTDLAPGDIAYSQLIPTNDVITSVTGVTPRCLRTPYGATSPTVYKAAANSGLEIVGWHLNPGDYNDPGSDVIASRVFANLTVGSIVLLHDAGAGDRQQTVDAVSQILAELSARGLRAAALCQ